MDDGVWREPDWSEQVWAVVLELGVARGRDSLPLVCVEGLLEALAELEPMALYNPNRCALQVLVVETSVPGALRAAIRHYDLARRRLNLPDWPLIRAEVLTRDELVATSGPEVGDDAEVPIRPDAPDGREAVYQSTRSLLGVTTVEEIRAILAGFVLAVGGTIQVGDVLPGPSTLPLDISVGGGPSLFAVAEPMSVARLLLGEWLPTLLEDGRRASILLERIESDSERHPSTVTGSRPRRGTPHHGVDAGGGGNLLGQP